MVYPKTALTVFLTIIALALTLASSAWANTTRTVRVVNDKGVPQMATVAYMYGSEMVYAKTDAEGLATVHPAPVNGTDYSFTANRGSWSDTVDKQPCGDPFPNLNPHQFAPGQSEMTITVGSLPLPEGSPEISSSERRFLGRLNQERAALGRPPLKFSTTLNKAAAGYVQYLSDKQISSNTHCRMGGPNERASDKGWVFDGWGVGETIHISPASADESLSSFKTSGAHWNELTNTQYTYVGVGHGPNHWVVKLGRTPRGGLDRAGLTDDAGDPNAPDDSSTTEQPITEEPEEEAGPARAVKVKVSYKRKKGSRKARITATIVSGEAKLSLKARHRGRALKTRKATKADKVVFTVNLPRKKRSQASLRLFVDGADGYQDKTVKIKAR